MSIHPGILTGSAVASVEDLEEIIRSEYQQFHPGDTLELLKHRAAFDKHDKGLLQSWLALATRRAGELEGLEHSAQPPPKLSIQIG